MIDIHLDAAASAVNFFGSIVLAMDALRARRLTMIKRGGEKLVEGIRKTGKIDLIFDPAGNPLNDNESLEDSAVQRTAARARLGFIMLAGGFALDLISKIFCNPLLFSK
jgi:hypothetical protein